MSAYLLCVAGKVVCSISTNPVILANYVIGFGSAPCAYFEVQSHPYCRRLTLMSDPSFQFFSSSHRPGERAACASSTKLSDCDEKMTSSPHVSESPQRIVPFVIDPTHATMWTSGKASSCWRLRFSSGEFHNCLHCSDGNVRCQAAKVGASSHRPQVPVVGRACSQAVSRTPCRKGRRVIRKRKNPRTRPRVTAADIPRDPGTLSPDSMGAPGGPKSGGPKGASDLTPRQGAPGSTRSGGPGGPQVGPESTSMWRKTRVVVVLRPEYDEPSVPENPLR